jgi:leucyl-tRNA synthetase
LRCSGKDLIPNHLTFFLFNHAAFFPDELLPKGIEVNGYISIEGEKLSKSKGPVLPISWVIRDYGTDASRLYISMIADPRSDADFKHSEIMTIIAQLNRFYELAMEIIELQIDEEEYAYIDRWLLSQSQRRTRSVTKALDEFEVREAVRQAFIEYMNDVKWYLRRTEMNKRSAKALYLVLDTWVRLMAPFTPHICEEIWEKMGRADFLSLSSWPIVEEELEDSLELSEEFIRNTIDDIQEIKKVTKMEEISQIRLYVAPDWKWELLKIASDIEEPDMGTIMKEAMKNEKVRLGRCAEGTSKLPEGQRPLRKEEEVSKFVKMIIDKNLRSKMKIEEYALLNDAKEFIAREVGAKEIEVIRADESEEHKAKRAIPLRPAIIIL